MPSSGLSDIMELIFREGSILSFLDTLDKRLVIIDNDEFIIFANKKAKTMLHRTYTNLQGQKISKYTQIDQLKDVLKEGSSYFRINGHIGEDTVWINVSPIEISRYIVGAVLVFEENGGGVQSCINTVKLCNGISRELETIFNTSYDEFLVTDSSGTILKINSLYRQFYSLETEALTGQNVFELEKKGVFNPSVTAKVIQEKKRVSTLQKTNSDKILIVTGHPIFDENRNLLSVICMAKDVTDLHRLREKLEQVEKTASRSYYRLELFRQKESSQSIVQYRSAQMAKVMDMASKVASVDSTILVTGESGVGKGVLAKSIHYMSCRKDHKMISINCGAIPGALMESEFFGYDKGAFTGARVEGKVGCLDLADKGTLFLDEISELPLHMQVKLLKVIQEKTYMRVGGTQTLQSDFRLIAATNKSLEKEVREGRFREDLYYRLNVVPIHVPPLRERKEDIILLSSYFWERLNQKYNTEKKLDADVYNALTDYFWPGNVRELENCIERIMVTVDKDIVHITDLPLFLVESSVKDIDTSSFTDLNKTLDHIERKMILNAFKRCNNTYKTAEMLGVSQSTIVRKMKKYNISEQ